MKYRINASFDGENFFWVVIDNNNKLIRNPTKEDLQGAKTLVYNETNVCSICREKYENDGIDLTDNSILYPKNARHSLSKHDEYVCQNHYSRSWQTRIADETVRKVIVDKYTSVRYIDGTVRKIIIDKVGNIVNSNPAKEELHDIEDTTYTLRNKYKIFVDMDEQNKFWIVIHKGDFVSNPTEEDLKDSELKYYSKTNICPLCKKEYDEERKELTYRSILYPNNALCTQVDGIKIWYCQRHNTNHRSHLPDSTNNLMKALRDRRMGNLRDPANILGDNCEELTSIIFGVKRLSIEYDKYVGLLDHSPIPKGTYIIVGGELLDLSDKIPQTKGRTYNSKYEWWNFGNFEKSDWYKNYDIQILWCASNDGLRIERGYIILKKTIYDIETKKGLKGMAIYKSTRNRSGNPTKYEKNRIDKEFLKNIDINKIWKEIIETR